MTKPRSIVHRNLQNIISSIDRDTALIEQYTSLVIDLIDIMFMYGHDKIRSDQIRLNCIDPEGNSCARGCIAIE